VLGRYPTPRFLASAWFGGDTPELRQPRHWFIAHARGRRFRELAMLPLVMTRKMEHALIRGPHHLDVTASLRRAQVIGLGGSPELADAILATRLGRSFAREELWRPILELVCRSEDGLDVADVPIVIDYVASRDAAIDGVSLETLVREAKGWRPPALRPRARRLCWAPAPWQRFVFEVTSIRWEIVELVDSFALMEEGYAMRNCVASYASKCHSGAASIWALRRHADGDLPRSLLTIEIDPRRGAIVQVKGPRNRPGTPRALELLRMWATREQLVL